MRKPKKRHVILLCSVILLLILVSLGVLYINRNAFFPHRLGAKKFTGNIFGRPTVKTDYTFPVGKPEFDAKIASIKSSSSEQQTISIYKIADNKKTPIFERKPYADGFRGNVLTYTFASDSASISQHGSLGSIGCSGNECSMMWSNFYRWDAQQQAFVLDNASHKEFFQQLLIPYQTLDKRGCDIVGSTMEQGQSGISLTQLYTKYPGLPWYCSKSEGILPSSLIFFLKAEKAVQEVIGGKNIGASDIQGISL